MAEITLNDKRVLLIEFILHDAPDVLHLRQDINLNEFSYVMLNLKVALENFSRALIKKNPAKVVDTQALTGAWMQHLKPLMNWVAEGHRLVLHFSWEAKVDSGGLAWPLAPFEGLTIRPLKGRNIRYVGPDVEFESSGAQYHAVFESPSFKPLFVVDRASPGPDQIVGGYFNHGKGRIFILPDLHFQFVYDASQAVGLCMDVEEALTRSVSLPDWVNSYLMPEELKAAAAIKKANALIVDLNIQIEAQRAVIDEAYILKALIAGTDDDAEIAVRKVLRDLGAKASEEVGKRADSVGYWKGIPLAIEVKGRQKSLNEDDWDQTEIWRREVKKAIGLLRRGEGDADKDMTHYHRAFAEIGLDGSQGWPEDCPGLLVGVTHIKKPLDQRTKSDHAFPPDVINKMKSSRVLGVTGYQLLLLYLECRDNPIAAAKLLDELFSGSGGLLARQPDPQLLTTIVDV